MEGRMMMGGGWKEREAALCRTRRAVNGRTEGLNRKGGGGQ